MRHLASFALCLVSLASLTGCHHPQPVFVRGSDVQGLDDPAMSTKLDRRDLERALRENMDSFVQSRFYNNLRNENGQPPTAAIMTMENWTSEHIEPQLQALLGMVETQLVNSGKFTVVSAALRDKLLAELRTQQGKEFDQARAVSMGRQLGVAYFVTGRVVDNAERTADARRVQYFMFMQALDVATGAIVWQNEAAITKALVQQ
jgi:uncharacterized protein (TIGR02722 family)